MSTENTVDLIFDAWDLKSITDEEVVKDIKAALEESYMRGCLDGALDLDKAHDALEFLIRHKHFNIFNKD